ncbi:MAG: M20/M25/M40 family metallo-hydrolase [Saprospiraceae bacterium]
MKWLLLVFLFFPLFLPAQTNDDAVEALSQYLRFPSLSGEEVEAGRFFADLCAARGLHLTFMGEENGHFNFAASLYALSERKPNVLFLNHIDVVEADASKQVWRYPPFSGTVAEGKIWGRGAYDNKGAGIMQLFAIASFAARARAEDLPFNVTLLAVSCEETQCEGGLRSVIRDYLEMLNPVVVFGEGPPSLGGAVPSHPEKLIYPIAVGHKRALWLQLHSEVDCLGHGSVTPHVYCNKEMVHALDRLMGWKPRLHFNRQNVRMLRELGSLEGGVTGFFLRHPRLLKPVVAPALRKEPALAALFSNNLTVTTIHGGNEAVNVIPRQCTALIDCRLLPHTDQDKYLKRLRKKMGKADIAIDIMMDMPQVALSSEDSPFYEALYQSISAFYPDAAVFPVIIPNITDDGWFRAAGIPCYSSIPVHMTRESMECIHAADEHIPVQSLYDGIAVYTDLIGRIFCFTGLAEE